MILVDTSVWIAVFSRSRPLDLTAHVELDSVVTCLPVIQEVLQGFRDEAAYRKARIAMHSLPIVDAPMEPAVFQTAVDLFRNARRAGVTVRSSIDCLIAASAIRHDLTVLHRDRDFRAIAKLSSLHERAV